MKFARCLAQALVRPASLKGRCNGGRIFNLIQWPAVVSQQPRRSSSSQTETQTGKRTVARSAAAKPTLRRAKKESQHARHTITSRCTVTAYCAAEEYDLVQASQMLHDVGYKLDPSGTQLSPHVLHFQYPPFGFSTANKLDNSQVEAGDVFIFTNGTVVAWNVEEDYIKRLIRTSLRRSAMGSHADRIEMEDLEYYEEPSSESSQVQGDLIMLGVGVPAEPIPMATMEAGVDGARSADEEREFLQRSHRANLVLTKIAFSCGLARSTNVAVLESDLERYFESTREIPTVLSTRKTLPYTRSFILRKTGELLRMRAQLNLSSELTDSLPDLFWDSRYELGLEGYFVQVSRALDVGVRIKALNEKMNYAQEIASVLQERLSEKHGLFLEWLIIILISIEVCFELGKLVKERVDRQDEESVESLLKKVLEKMEEKEARPRSP